MDFQKVNYEIQKFLYEQDINTYDFDDKDYKLPTSDAIFCAEDTPRNRKFFEALEQSINDIKKQKEKVTVVDAWAGTGILWIFWLLLWADKAIFIEHNPYSIQLCKKVVKHFDLEEKSVFLQWDACDIDIEESFDILVSETIKSNFINEDFPYIVNHLRKYATKFFTIIPEGFELEILDEKKNFLKQENINSYEMPIPFNLDLPKDIQQVFLKWTTYFYWDASNYSWDCMSYFNELPLTKEDNSFLEINAR